MDKTKIKNINNQYVELIEHFHLLLFKNLKIKFDNSLGTKQLIKELMKQSKHKIILPTNYGSSSVGYLEYQLNSFYDNIKNFWNVNKNEFLKCIKNTNLNGIILWDNALRNSAITKHLLYYDFVFIPDPIYEYTTAWDSLNLDGKLSKVAGWIFYVLELKEYAFSSLDVPLVIFFPEFLGPKSVDSKKLRITEVCESLVLKTLRDELNLEKDFDNISAFKEFINAERLDKLNKNLNYKKIYELIDSDNLLNPLRMPSSLNSIGLENMISLKYGLTNNNLSKADIFNLIVYVHVVYRLVISRELNGTFLNSDVGGSKSLMLGWNQRNAYLKADYLKSSSINDIEIMAMSFQTGFTWLNDLSMNECIRLRENGYLEDMRKILGSHKTQLAFSDEKDFLNLSKQYEENVIMIINEESKKMQLELDSIKKNFRLSSVSLSVATALTVASFIMPPISIISAILGIGIGTKSINDLLGQHQNKAIYQNSLQFRPANILISHLNNNINL